MNELFAVSVIAAVALFLVGAVLGERNWIVGRAIRVDCIEQVISVFIDYGRRPNKLRFFTRRPRQSVDVISIEPNQDSPETYAIALYTRLLSDGQQDRLNRYCESVGVNAWTTSGKVAPVIDENAVLPPFTRLIIGPVDCVQTLRDAVNHIVQEVFQWDENTNLRFTIAFPHMPLRKMHID